MADSSVYQSQDMNPAGGISQNIFSQIRKEQWDFMFNWISIVPGYPFNQYWTIKRAHLYLNSRFEDAQQYFGRDKIFFNIVVPPCEVAARMLNVDTKNIRLWPIEPKSYFSTYLLEKELKWWLKKHKLGHILNQLADEAPKFGSVVLEKTPDGAEVVDLRRLMLDPTVDSIQDSRFVTTVHYMTDSQLRDTSWYQDAVEDAIDRYANMNTQEPYEDQYVNVNLMRSTPYIKVFKRYGEVPRSWLEDGTNGQKYTDPDSKKGKEMVKALFIVAGADWTQKNNDGKDVREYGVVLYKAPWNKDWPFKDFHYTKTRGRWLGIGVTEMLFPVQERINEMKNQKRVAMEISSLHLFQSKDKTIVRNILSDLQSGDVLLAGPNGGITPVENEERNLPAFKDEEESYTQQVDKLSFAYEAIRGDTTDVSQATLGQTQIAVAQGTSVFAFKKENLGLFLQEYFNDLVMPQLMKDLNAEHIMRFTGSAQELQSLDEAAAELHANEYAKTEILGGRMVTKDHVEQAKDLARKTYAKLGENRFLKIKEAFYDDAEFEFDFLVVNEQADPSIMANNIQQVIGEVAGNPAILQDPRLKLLFYKLCEQLGISQAELELADQQAQKQEQAQAQQQQLPPGKPPQLPTASMGLPSGTLSRAVGGSNGGVPTIKGISQGGRF